MYIIRRLQSLELPLARIAIFIVYFWFGALKLLGLSPATFLVQELFLKTIAFRPFSAFYILFSLFEILIGILFLVRGCERLAVFLIWIHLMIIVLPLFLLSQRTWQAFLVPTLEGQYIIKNILIAAVAVVVGA